TALPAGRAGLRPRRAAPAGRQRRVRLHRRRDRCRPAAAHPGAGVHPGRAGAQPAHHYPAGAVDFTLNALPGAAAALLLGWGPVAAVALAGITWISSSGVIAKVLGDLGRIGNRETPVVLSILVFEDLSMAVYLPILTALLAGAGLIAG